MQTRDIKRRIRSIKSTQQITRAMKFVAAAKLRKAQERMLAMRPYADSLDDVLRHLAVDLIGDEHPFFRKVDPEKIKRVAVIVIAGDRGLCGGFNTNILRAARQHFEAMPNIEPVIFAIGKRAIGQLRKTNFKIVRSYHDVFEKLSYVLSGEICDILVNMINGKDAEKIDAAYIVYNEFVTVITQKPVVKQILPIDLTAFVAKPDKTKEKEENSATNTDNNTDSSSKEMEEEEVKVIRPVYDLQPDPETALKRLVSRRLATDVYRGTLESYAAELAARMSAMDNATNNAAEIIDNLTLIYNRVRQAGITSELIDIVGGSNAVG